MFLFKWGDVVGENELMIEWGVGESSESIEENGGVAYCVVKVIEFGNEMWKVFECDDDN